MGMRCSLVELDKDQIDKLLADPENVFDYLDELEENEEVGGVGLDKAWRGIHFLLTGSVIPARLLRGPPHFSGANEKGK